MTRPENAPTPFPSRAWRAAYWALLACVALGIAVMLLVPRPRPDELIRAFMVLVAALDVLLITPMASIAVREMVRDQSFSWPAKLAMGGAVLAVMAFTVVMFVGAACYAAVMTW